LTYAIAVFEAKLAQPHLGSLAFSSSLTAQTLFQQVVSKLLQEEDVADLLRGLPTNFW
jgi:hypothetical protein